MILIMLNLNTERIFKMNKIDAVQRFLSKQNLTLHFVLEYGSQAFNLDNDNSDYDYLAVYSRPSDFYIGLEEEKNSLGTIVVGENNSFQFMDLKHFFQLSQSSNFLLYVGLQNIVWQSYRILHVPSPYEFSMNRLAHHCLGLIDNKSQRQYFKAYSSLFVMFLMQNGHLPTSLDYKFLLNNTKNVQDNVIKLLEMKKNGQKLSDIEVSKPFTHEEVNVLPNYKLDYNEVWLRYLKESLNNVRE